MVFRIPKGRKEVEMEEIVEPIFFEPGQDSAKWETVTREVILWAKKNRRLMVDGPRLHCHNQCGKEFEGGDPIFVVYEKRAKIEYRNIYCSVLCQRQLWFTSRAAQNRAARRAAGKT